MLTPKTRFSRWKGYFIYEILFYSVNFCFCREKLVEFPGFIRWKRPFNTENTSVNTENEVLSSKSVLFIWNSILQWKPQFLWRKTCRNWVLFGGKDRFILKIPVLTPKTRFSRRKEYFISEIVFYSGNLSFCRENLVEIPVFIRWKRLLRNKNISVNTENEVFSSKRVLFIWNSILHWKPQFLYRKTCRNSGFYSLEKTVSL